MTMTWQNGRQLSTLQKGTTAVSYTYDANSTRATKTVNGVKYTYQYIGGKLIHETRGEKSFHYYYDANGYLTSIKYRLTPTGQDFAYYATHNWRGDVIGLYNGDGDLKAKYEYDTWGKVTSVKDANGTRISDQNHVGNLNPFRYRGYYYDTESQLYYLMTRYYDPVVHRFINADGYFQSGGNLLDANMSAYCGNNPVNYSDSTGTSCHYAGHPKYHPGCHVSPYDGFCNLCGVKDCCYPEDRVIPEKKYTVSTGQEVVVTNDENYNSNINQIVVYDSRTASDPNMQIIDSYLIDAENVQREVIYYLQKYNERKPVNPAWKRTDDSMVLEWDIHNKVYKMGIAQDSTRSVDLNNNDEGKGWLEFLWERGSGVIFG